MWYFKIWPNRLSGGVYVMKIGHFVKPKLFRSKITPYPFKKKNSRKSAAKQKGEPLVAKKVVKLPSVIQIHTKVIKNKYENYVWEIFVKRISRPFSPFTETLQQNLQSVASSGPFSILSSINSINLLSFSSFSFTCCSLSWIS